MNVLHPADELHMPVAEARAIVLAASAEDNFMLLSKDDLSCLFHLILRQLIRMDEQLKQL